MTSLFDSVDVDLLPSIRLRNRRTAERLDTGHLPTCPFCAELNFPGLARCGNCCAPLYRQFGRESTREATSPSLPARLCSTCLVEVDEDGYCDTCGITLGKAAA